MSIDAITLLMCPYYVTYSYLMNGVTHSGMNLLSCHIVGSKSL